MNNHLVLWGAGGHGKVVLDAARAMGCFRSIAIVDSDPSKIGQDFCGLPVGAGPEELHRWRGSAFVIAIGDNKLRAECFNRACQQGLEPATVIHPSAVVAPSATVGAGTALLPGTIVNASAVIGVDCIVNSGAIVEHDCSVGDHVHIAPRAVLGGAVAVGHFALIGIGAVLLPGCVVGEEAVVGAGATVLKRAPANSTVAGVPAKVISHG